MIFATAGHVDHGKTSLVKAITNVDTDRLAEEKARGLTIDLGFAYQSSGNQRIGFIDVPGHAKFISNMLAGVSTIDHALIVIAADDGPMPQTQEHLDILALLGIDAATIAVSKADRVSGDHLENTRGRIQELLSATPYVDAPMFITSVETGAGINELKSHLFSLHNAKPSRREDYFRLAIDRKFSIKGAGTVVTGSAFSGQIQTGRELWLMPQKKKVRLRGLHRQDEVKDEAGIGDRCALNITGEADQDDINRGDWITDHPDLPVSERIDVELTLLKSELGALRTGTPVHFHLGAKHALGRVFLLNERHLGPGESNLAQIKLEEAISSCTHDRFVIRDQSANRTLGGGRVLDPISVKKGRSKPERIEYLKIIRDQTSLDLDQLLLACPSGLDLNTLYRGMNLPLSAGNYPQDKRGRSYHSQVFSSAQEQLKQALNKQPASLPDLSRTTGLKPALCEAALEALVAEKKLNKQGNLYAPAQSQPTLSKPAETLWKKVEPLLSIQPLQPPVTSELAKTLSLPAAALDKLLGECIKQGLIVKPVKNRYFLSSAMQTLRRQAIEVAENHGGEFTVIEFRDASGLGRNLVIELLEHLDSKGFTRRLGDKRVIQDTER